MRLAAGYVSRERFLTELTLDPPAATSDESGPAALDEDYLILSTIHSAKGQEWSAVSVLNVVDGCIPSDMATGRAAEIEEERRLLYVAMTRARDHLHLLVPQRFYVTQQSARGDRHLYAAISRFLPESIRDRFVHLGAASAAAAAEAAADRGGADRGRGRHRCPRPGRLALGVLAKRKRQHRTGRCCRLTSRRRSAARLDLCAVVRSCRWRP